MNVFKLGVRFGENLREVAEAIIAGKRTILFAEGKFLLPPDEQFLMFMDYGCPSAAIATVGKVSYVSMTANEARDVGAALISENHNHGGIETKVFTELRIVGIEILPMSIEAIVAKKYADGELREE